MVNQLGWGTIVRYGLYCAHARKTQIYLLTDPEYIDDLWPNGLRIASKHLKLAWHKVHQVVWFWWSEQWTQSCQPEKWTFLIRLNMMTDVFCLDLIRNILDKLVKIKKVNKGTFFKEFF